MTPSRPFGAWVRTAASEFAASCVDLALPAACAACEAPSAGPLCCACLILCHAPAGPACPRCGGAWTRGGACGRCRRFPRPFAYATASALWRYRGPVRRLVHAFKYRGRDDVLGTLGRAMARHPRCTVAACLDPLPLVVPIPARRRSRRERGYDQAVLLGRAFAQALAWPEDSRALARRRQTPPQAGRPRHVRRLQSAAAFRAVPWRIDGRAVVLIDDVLTTGATADAASRALLLAGAPAVHVVVLAT